MVPRESDYQWFFEVGWLLYLVLLLLSLWVWLLELVQSVKLVWLLELVRWLMVKSFWFVLILSFANPP